jgi:hypothetical protein
VREGGFYAAVPCGAARIATAALPRSAQACDRCARRQAALSRGVQHGSALVRLATLTLLQRQLEALHAALTDAAAAAAFAHAHAPHLTQAPAPAPAVGRHMGASAHAFAGHAPGADGDRLAAAAHPLQGWREAGGAPGDALAVDGGGVPGPEPRPAPGGGAPWRALAARLAGAARARLPDPQALVAAFAVLEAELRAGSPAPDAARDAAPGAAAGGPHADGAPLAEGAEPAAAADADGAGGSGEHGQREAGGRERGGGGDQGERPAAGGLGAAGLAMARLLAVQAAYARCLPEAVADARVIPSRLLPQAPPRPAPIPRLGQNCGWSAGRSLPPCGEVVPCCVLHACPAWQAERLSFCLGRAACAKRLQTARTSPARPPPACAGPRLLPAPSCRPDSCRAV